MTALCHILRSLFVLVAIVACQGLFEDRDPSDPCDGVTCSGHGECVLVDEGSRAACVCDTGFEEDGLECVPLGADGDADADVDVDADADSDSDNEPCEPDCGDRVCGPDPVCGTESCGECADSYQCSDDGRCECVPDCEGRTCGSDGCGGRCPPGCGDFMICEDGTCNVACDENFSWGNPCFEVDECDDGSTCSAYWGFGEWGTTCLRACDSDEDCPDIADGFEHCMDGWCFIVCDTVEECPCDLECREASGLSICYP